MSVEPSGILTWQTKLASQELCLRVKKCFGAMHIMLPNLLVKEQVQFQGLDRWTYHTGVTRAQKSISFDRVFLFPVDSRIWQLSYPSPKVTALKTDIEDLNPWGWKSIQVGKDLFQIKDRSSKCRLIKNLGYSRFSVIQKAQTKEVRYNASFCSMDNKFIFGTGGYHNSLLMNKVERYDIARDVWEEMPPMNQVRWVHGSCAIGTAVYVVCGCNMDYLNSIEKLETLDLQAGWQLIRMPPTSLLTRRKMPVVAALNENEILIMGGQYYEKMDDVLAFDTRTGEVRQNAKNASLKFSGSFSQQSVQVRPGVIIALVAALDVHHKLIEFSNGTVKVLQ